MPARVLTFDIETCATDAHAERCMTERWDASAFTPRNGAKDAAVIARQKEEAEHEFEAGRLARVDAGALSARTGRVLLAGLRQDDSLGVLTPTAASEDTERSVLDLVWHDLREASRVVSFGGLVFDIPFVVQRSALLGMAPLLPRGGVAALLRRYTTDRHFDVRAILCNYDFRQPGTKNDWSQAFQLEMQTVTGADVGRLHREGKHEEIGKHCADDCRQTYAMYQRLAVFYGA